MNAAFLDLVVPGAEAARGKSVEDDVVLIRKLQEIVRRSHVLTGPEATRRFRSGIRFGSGPVVAVVRPGSLVEQWRVFKACVAANKIVIMQASNTGVTGGSTPGGDDYDRGVVLINAMRIEGLRLINDGKQVVCLPGSTRQIEERVWALLDRRGAEYPAEHNVGRLYHAKPALAAHYKALDPCNVLNPGIGRTTKCAHWKPMKMAPRGSEMRCEG